MASNVPEDLSKNNESQNSGENSSSDSSQSSLVSKLPGVKFLKEKVKKTTSKIKSYSDRIYWDPLASNDWDVAGPPNHFVSTRIKRDLTALFKEPLPGIFAIPDEKNFCLVHCLILGPFETPYEGGYFHFAVRFGPSYPIHPPRVRMLTTGGGKVRFNPNLYSNGKVCLSILGLLNDKPYFNEPGFKTEHYYGESDKYNIYLTHETIRISVCSQLEQCYGDKRKQKAIPAELAEVMRESFLDLYSDYIETCNKYKHLDGQEMTDIFGCCESLVYSFEKLISRLKRIKEILSALKKETNEKEKESSLSSISDEDEYDKFRNASSSLPTAKPIDLDAEDDEFVESLYDGNDDVDLFYNDEDDDDDDDDEELKEVNEEDGEKINEESSEKDGLSFCSDKNIKENETSDCDK
ncbi:Ubiquitin-conjugating enzyme E2 Z [Armadillidium nasatum]|uniref:Ubiquitin-conjugating enzyme E2 Z n=1 Tax=Armadillidium nasatum TaxID=96803 RepID=A0A5N5SZP8_9CRUS|nr:Ubiquitin-conjugating enzyme E2 Z [Armadillidium nasatum]